MAFSHCAIVFLVGLSLLGLGTNSQVPDPVALYPLDGDHGTKEINNRVGAGVASGVHTAPGPDGKPDGSYEFSGTVNSYIEFPNGGGLDVKNSITMLCWLYPGGRDGPLFNYRGHKSGSWGVHLWVVSGQLFVRFNKRDYSSTNALLRTPLKPEDGWKFVGASYDQANGHAKLWVDGKVVQTLNIGANLQLATQDSVRMGAKVGDGRYFKGRIAQMQVYNVALTQEQVKLIKERTQVVLCTASLGMESRVIKDAQITASSQWDSNHAASQGRLNFKAGGGKAGGWLARYNDANQWIQVAFGSYTTLTGIATQGRDGHRQWVTKYRLQYSDDGVHFHYYKALCESLPKVFNGNKDVDSIVRHKLNPPIQSCYIRLRPTVWSGHISLRMEVYGCLANATDPVPQGSRRRRDVGDHVTNVFSLAGDPLHLMRGKREEKRRKDLDKSGSSSIYLIALYVMCLACLAGTVLMIFKKSRDKSAGYGVLASVDQE